MKLFVIIFIIIDCLLIETRIISTFKPRLIQTDNDSATLEYIFTIDNKHHHIILTESEFNNHETIVSVDGKPYKRITHPKGTFLVGRTANNPKNKIYIHFNKGINGLFLIDNTTLEIMPIKKFKNLPDNSLHAKTLQNNDHDHIAQFYEKEENEHFTCGVTWKHLKNRIVKKMKYYDPHFSVLPDKRNVTSILRLGVAIPVELYQDPNFGNNDTKTAIDRALLIVYSSNLLYEATNILVLTYYIEIFTDNSIISPLKGSTLDATLDIVDKTIRPRFNSALNYFVSIVLFTKHADYPHTGLAWSDTMCGKFSNAVILAGNLERTVVTMTHEVGHNFGLLHTIELRDPKCHCEKICIMNGGASSGPIDNFSWNTCDYDVFLKALNLSCLIPMPNLKPLNSIYCGNNKIDQGEDCDCGLPSECAKKNLDKFCDPFSCKYYSGCNCLEGVCCKNCQIQPINSSCNFKNNDCSIGICTGAVDICKSNGSLPNGTKCNGNQDVCFNGTCLKHGSKCVDNYGKSAILGNKDCFKYFNSRNDQSGNCGYDPIRKKFIPCTQNDFECGLLVCKTNNQNIVENEYTFEVNPNNCTVKFSTVIGDNFSNILSVSDGVSCDTNKICWSNKCLTNEQIFEKILYEKCGLYSTLSNENECMCIKDHVKVNNLCFLEKHSLKALLPLIIIISLIQIFSVVSFATFWALIFRESHFNLTIRGKLTINN